MFFGLLKMNMGDNWTQIYEQFVEVSPLFTYRKTVQSAKSGDSSYGSDLESAIGEELRKDTLIKEKKARKLYLKEKETGKIGG